MLKAGDVIEFTIQIDVEIPEEVSQEGKPISLDDYKRTYTVSYAINDTEVLGEYFVTVNEGECALEDDIENYVKEEMKSSYSEVTEYEIEYIDRDSCYERAKVRIKAVKE